MKSLNSNLHLYLIILVSILVFGCREVYEFDTTIANDELNFTINEISDINNKHLMLYDISVVKQHCNSDCTVWELVREQNKLEMSNKNYLSLPIKYGQAIVNTLDKVAPKPVDSGEYAISATIAVIDDGKIKYSRLVHGRFTVKKSEDGKISLVQ